MNQIEQQKVAVDPNMDAVSYFHTLIREGGRHSILGASALEKLQYELLKLLTDQFNRFTSGFSSSVPVETGEQIQQSVFYTAGYYLKNLPDAETGLERLQSNTLSVIYAKGKEFIEVRFKEAKELMKDLQQQRLDLDVYAYQDTLMNGIPIFFSSYDMDYGAHDNPGSVDYPLCLDKMNLTGVDYVLTYLRKLRLENEICRCFSADEIQELLKGYDPRYQELLFNLFELIFNNAVGCRLLGRSDGFLKISAHDRQYLQYKLSSLSAGQQQELVDNAAAGLIEFLLAVNPKLREYSDPALVDYISGASSILKVRLKNTLETGNLQHLFLSFRENPQSQTILYEDSMGLDDEAFRHLSEEIRSCRHVSDKLFLMKNGPISTKDLVDLLECGSFYGNEFFDVFESLEPIQLALLVKHIPLDPTGSGLWGNEGEKEWQIFLIHYLEQIHHQKKEALISIAERIKLTSVEKN